MLLERIKSDLKIAMVERNTVTRDLLRVLVGQIETKSKQEELTESAILKIIKSLIDGAKLCNTLYEIPILEAYLPTKLTEMEVTTVLSELVDGLSSKEMGVAMKRAQNKFGDRYDGSLVSKLIKESFLKI